MKVMNDFASGAMARDFRLGIRAWAHIYMDPTVKWSSSLRNDPSNSVAATVRQKAPPNFGLTRKFAT